MFDIPYLSTYLLLKTSIPLLINLFVPLIELKDVTIDWLLNSHVYKFKIDKTTFSKSYVVYNNVWR